MNHTPGPWRFCVTTYAGLACGFHIVSSPEGSSAPLCEAKQFDRSPSELEANARLMAAAPEMLMLLKAYSAYFVEKEFKGLAEECANLISKATGAPVVS